MILIEDLKIFKLNSLFNIIDNIKAFKRGNVLKWGVNAVQEPDRI